MFWSKLEFWGLSSLVELGKANRLFPLVHGKKGHISRDVHPWICDLALALPILLWGWATVGLCFFCVQD